MEQSPYWETYSHSGSQEIIRPFMEPQGSLPCSQGSAIRPYPEPDESSPHLPHCFPKIHSNIMFLFTHSYSKWSLIFRFPNQITVYILRLSHTCYMPHPSHPSSFNHFNIWWSVQVTKLLPIADVHKLYRLLPLIHLVLQS